MCSTSNESDESIVERFKRDYTEQFYILLRMHLSFVLDLNTSESEYFLEKCKLKKWNLVPFGKKAKSRSAGEGISLTQEVLNQVYQLIEFIKKEPNIKCEGIFRRTGSVERQQELRYRLNQGEKLHLEGGPFSVHDCASVLKSYLADLPDPLVNEAHFPAYCHIAELYSIIQQPGLESKLLEALQLLFLLLPAENKSLLKDILHLLNITASFENYNRMSSDNLAKLFTPHLLCPRKLSPENLLKDSQNLFGIVSFMIKKSPEVFKMPGNLVLDFRAKYEKKNILSPTKRLNESVSDAASTVFTFVDQERTAKENESNPTETALAQLYAHIQSLPESSKKRKLVKQFNKENGHGTPLQYVRGNTTKNKSIGDSIKKHIFHKGLAKKRGFSLLRTSSDEVLSETMMTPRSRKPVLLISGTNINALNKNEQPNTGMNNLTEELSGQATEDRSLKHNIKKSKSDDDIVNEPLAKVPKINKCDTPSSLSATFREYLINRGMHTLSSPSSLADSSFSSRTDDFNSTNFKDFSNSKLTDSLLYCLDGNEPDSVDFRDFSENDTGEKELVLKPKQFDEDGKPIIFETSF